MLAASFKESLASEAAIRMLLLLLLRVKRGREKRMPYGFHESPGAGTELAQIEGVDRVPSQLIGSGTGSPKGGR